MELIGLSDPRYEARLRPLFERSAFQPAIDAAVAEMLAAVRQEGDAAVCRFAAQYDQAHLTPAQFRLTPAELAGAADRLTAREREALALAHAQVRAFAEAQRPSDWRAAPRPGVSVGERFTPLARVAAYIPGGSAPLVSTVLHTLTLAQVAGVPRRVLTTPPGPDGAVHPAILHAAALTGCSEVYRLGGVYGVAALAYGTATIPRVDKIVGPGNAYVTAAKRQVYGTVSLDLVAGPSEVAIIADADARPDWIAADLLAQAEHGSGHEQAVLFSTHEPLLAAVAAEVTRQAASLPPGAGLQRVLASGIFLVAVRDLDHAVALANDYAPEHLEIHTADPEAVATGISAAGAIFLGPWTPEPVGDFVAGPSHVLPTGGAARYLSGLTVGQFYRRQSLVRYDRPALAREGWAVAEFSAMERLPAHGRSVTIRQA